MTQLNHWHLINDEFSTFWSFTKDSCLEVPAVEKHCSSLPVPLPRVRESWNVGRADWWKMTMLQAPRAKRQTSRWRNLVEARNERIYSLLIICSKHQIKMYRVFQRFRLNLGKSSEKTILGLILTIFNVSNNFWAAWSLPKIGISLNPIHHNTVKFG